LVHILVSKFEKRGRDSLESTKNKENNQSVRFHEQKHKFDINVLLLKRGVPLKFFHVAEKN
jgi:hypothetical protein